MLILIYYITVNTKSIDFYSKPHLFFQYFKHDLLGNTLTNGFFVSSSFNRSTTTLHETQASFPSLGAIAAWQYLHFMFVLF